MLTKFSNAIIAGRHLDSCEKSTFVAYATNDGVCCEGVGHHHRNGGAE